MARTWLYPIALFVDRLVEAVIQGDSVRVSWDRLDDSGPRHPPALKYIVTELLCNAIGGPELVTAKDLEETKLGISVQEWESFLALAQTFLVLNVVILPCGGLL